MSLPLVALVGRPNVGKSALFNRMVGHRAALVDDQPGVTRDRLFGEMEAEGRLVRLVDTGGLEVGSPDSLTNQVTQQTTLAIDEADLVLLVLDTADGLNPSDRDVAQLLRRAGKPTIIVANKVDVPGHEARVAECYELGMASVVAVSAEHGRGVAELCELVCARVEAPSKEEVEAASGAVAVTDEAEDGGSASRIEWAGGAIRVAVVGRPNVGKSSLINALLGQERLVASPAPGTTRDAVDTELSMDGQRYVFVDTAGMRRRRSVVQRVERFAVLAAVRSLERADVAVILLDATAGAPAVQDARIAAMAHESGKGVVLALNKCDLLHGDALKELEGKVRHEFPFVHYARLLRISAKTKRGLGKLSPTLMEAQRERHRRVGTGELNRLLKHLVSRHAPAVHRGRRPRLYYISQPLVRPPTFVISVQRPADVSPSYNRYLQNALRKHYGFAGSPIWIKFRQRGERRR